MPKLDETSLCGPVKRFLEDRGYDVKSEVHGCDLVAVRDAEIVVVELKTAMTLGLVLQGINRLKLTDLVYLAIPAPKRARMGRWSETTQLCRRLGLGLLTVHFRARGGPRVEIVVEPEPYKPRQATARRQRLLGEFGGRSGDHNVGGTAWGSPASRSSKRRLVTAYREEALQLAAVLVDHGPRTVASLREATGCHRAGPILRDNHYGWFAREERGVYGLTPAGKDALTEYADVLADPARPACETRPG